MRESNKKSHTHVRERTSVGEDVGTSLAHGWEGCGGRGAPRGPDTAAVSPRPTPTHSTGWEQGPADTRTRRGPCPSVHLQTRTDKCGLCSEWRLLSLKGTEVQIHVHSILSGISPPTQGHVVGFSSWGMCRAGQSLGLGVGQRLPGAGRWRGMVGLALGS